MADLYGRWVPDEWIAQVHAAMLQHPRFLAVRLALLAASGEPKGPT